MTVRFELDSLLAVKNLDVIPHKHDTVIINGKQYEVSSVEFNLDDNNVLVQLITDIW